MPRHSVLRVLFLVAALAAAEAPGQSASPSPQESAVSSEPGEVDPVGIHPFARERLLEGRDRPEKIGRRGRPLRRALGRRPVDLHPLLPRAALRGQHVAGEGLAGGGLGQPGREVGQLGPIVVAALPGAVEEEDQRVTPAGQRARHAQAGEARRRRRPDRLSRRGRLPPSSLLRCPATASSASCSWSPPWRPPRRRANPRPPPRRSRPCPPSPVR